MDESIPESRILDALIARLESVCSNVKVGYPATGLEDDMDVPAILVQLESLTELNRSGHRGLYQLQFLISLAVRTSDASTRITAAAQPSGPSGIGAGYQALP